jgi:hypothetical protein
MDNFEEYLRQGEPNKAEKAKIWKTAIGLQQVDGLKPSEYLITTAKQNIEGNISFEEVKQRIDSYYEQHPLKDNENRTEEADKVSARIAEILSEQTFTFSPAEYLSIHRRLFQGIYGHAGKMRDYNKKQNKNDYQKNYSMQLGDFIICPQYDGCTYRYIIGRKS